jgi:hypothetical protein
MYVELVGVVVVAGKLSYAGKLYGTGSLLMLSVMDESMNFSGGKGAKYWLQLIVLEHKTLVVLPSLISMRLGWFCGYA